LFGAFLTRHEKIQDAFSNNAIASLWESMTSNSLYLTGGSNKITRA